MCDIQILQDLRIGVLGNSYGDTVAHVSRRVWGESRQACTVDPPEAALKGWQALANVNAAPNRPYPSEGRREENFWRTIVNGAINDDGFRLKMPETVEKTYGTSWRRLRPTDKRVYEARWPHTQAAAAFNGPDGTPLPGREAFAHVLESEQIPYDQSMLTTILQRTFFVTDNGFMGTGPLTTLTGDRITVFFGGDVPFLLRKDLHGDTRDETSVGMSPCWNLVGDCYVHGIMDGEVMNTCDGQTRYLLR